MRNFESKCRSMYVYVFKVSVKHLIDIVIKKIRVWYFLPLFYINQVWQHSNVAKHKIIIKYYIKYHKKYFRNEEGILTKKVI